MAAGPSRRAAQSEPVKFAAQRLIEQRVDILTADVSNRRAGRSGVGKHDRPSRPTGYPDQLGRHHPSIRFQDLELETFSRCSTSIIWGWSKYHKACCQGCWPRGSGSQSSIFLHGGCHQFARILCLRGSKFAVRGFRDALRAELKPRGIHVAIVLPPDTDTPQLSEELPLRSDLVNTLSSLDTAMQPEEVAAAILKGLRKNKYFIIPGASNLFFFWLASLSGTFADSAMDLFIAWANRKIAKSKKES